MEPPSEVSVRSINFVRAFPWLRIGQAVSCALAPQPVTLGVVAAFLLTLLRMTVFRPDPDQPDLAMLAGAFESVPANDLLRPITDVWQQFWLAVMLPGWSFGRLLEPIVAFVIWTLVGVAIARCAAVQFCREENPSFPGSIRWSLRRAFNSLTAILTPLGGALILLVIAALIAVPSATPGVGLVWLQVAAPVQFILGTVAAFILLLLPLLWSLMVAAIAVDDSDAFDAFSRSFSLVTSRLWSTVGLLLLAGISGLVVIWAFRLLLDGSLGAVTWAAAWTTSEATTVRLAAVLTWWRGVVYHGLCGSLFWTHATIVYLFLREQVDAKPVFCLAGYDDAKPAFDPYPVVGMPAASPPDQSLKVTTDETNPDLGGEG